MTQSVLNQLNGSQLTKLAITSGTFLAKVVQSSVKTELYYLQGHFIEVNYCSKKFLGYPFQWRLCFAIHYPDIPASTPYLTLYLERIKLLID